MKTELDALLQSIDPEVTIEPLEERMNEALNSFEPRLPGTITKWPVFQSCMAAFYCHLENHLLRLRCARDPDFYMDWGRCAGVFLKIYGRDGEKTAFDIARTGVEGGLRAVLRTVAGRLVDEYARAEIGAKVSMYMNSLSADEWQDLADDYLDEFSDLLPEEITESNGVRFRINLYHGLVEHPFLLRKLQHCRG